MCLINAWKNFIAKPKDNELWSFLEECARKVYKRYQFREILELAEFNIQDSEYNDIIREIALSIWVFVNDNLSESTYFADLYEKKDFSRMAYGISSAFQRYLLDRARAGRTSRAYYRTCREVISDSCLLQCITIDNPSNRGGLPLGLGFAPASESNVQRADKPLFRPDEYSLIPDPPGIFQKDIRKAEHIVQAALFFWHEAARAKGRYFFLIVDFVKYIRVYYVIEFQAEEMPEDFADPNAASEYRYLELTQFFEDNLNQQEMNVLIYRMKGKTRKQTMEKFNLTEYAYKKIHKKISTLTDEFYEDT